MCFTEWLKEPINLLFRFCRFKKEMSSKSYSPSAEHCLLCSSQRQVFLFLFFSRNPPPPPPSYRSYFWQSNMRCTMASSRGCVLVAINGDAERNLQCPGRPRDKLYAAAGGDVLPPLHRPLGSLNFLWAQDQHSLIWQAPLSKLD